MTTWPVVCAGFELVLLLVGLFFLPQHPQSASFSLRENAAPFFSGAVGAASGPHTSRASSMTARIKETNSMIRRKMKGHTEKGVQSFYTTVLIR